jgi:hypothetical protein
MDLALTGSLFSLSGLVAHQYDNYTTAYASYCLALTSVLFHLQQSSVAYWLDQIALYTVVVRSFMDGYQCGVLGTSITSFINAYNYLVYFSPYSKWLRYHPIQHIGRRWHMSIHMMSVLGIILQQFCR